MERLVIMLVGHRPDEMEALLVDNEPALRDIADRAGARLRTAVRLEDDPLLAGEADGPRSIKPLHGVVELTMPGAATGSLADAAEEVAALLGDAIDWPASAVSVGEVHEVLPTASDTLLLVLGAYRLPSTDRQHFHDYWLNTHAALALAMLDDDGKARMGYQQLHASESRSAEAAKRTGAGTWLFDGVLEAALAEVTDLPHMRVPGFAEAIMEDETHFADQSAPMQGGFLRTLKGASS